MSAPESTGAAVRRGIRALEHLLIAADIARSLYPAARRGDAAAAALIHEAVRHMRVLGMTTDNERR